MKKLFLTFGIALFGFTAVLAQDSDILQEEDLDRTETESVEGEMNEAWEEGQEEVSLDALPVAVQDAVSTGEFANMEIKKAYRVSATQSGETAGAAGQTTEMASSEAYLVVLEGESGKKKVKVNEEGQIIESKDAHKGDKEKSTY